MVSYFDGLVGGRYIFVLIDGDMVGLSVGIVVGNVPGFNVLFVGVVLGVLKKKLLEC